MPDRLESGRLLGDRSKDATKRNSSADAKPEMTGYQVEMIEKFGRLIAAAAQATDYLQNGQVVILKYDVKVIELKTGQLKTETRQFALTPATPDALRRGTFGMYDEVMSPNPVLKDAADQLLQAQRDRNIKTVELNKWWDTPTE